jgi:hypothetical protein
LLLLLHCAQNSACTCVGGHLFYFKKKNYYEQLGESWNVVLQLPASTSHTYGHWWREVDTAAAFPSLILTCCCFHINAKNASQAVHQNTANAQLEENSIQQTTSVLSYVCAQIIIMNENETQLRLWENASVVNFAILANSVFSLLSSVAWQKTELCNNCMMSAFQAEQKIKSRFCGEKIFPPDFYRDFFTRRMRKIMQILIARLAAILHSHSNNCNAHLFASHKLI